MAPMIRYSAAGLLCLLIAAGSYVLGAKSRSQVPWAEVNAELAAIQASLSLNHLLRYRQLESDLAKGCVDEVLEKLRISVDQEMQLLASFHKEHKASWANKSIAERDPQLPEQLEQFKSKYGTSWSEPTCKR
jgi:hypothetical protein